MSKGNKILIDDAISEIVSQGREQVNLGSWANMQRMLDGENPYGDEDKRKKKGIFFLIGVLLLSLISGGVYYKFNNSNSEAQKIAQNLNSQNNIQEKQKINTPEKVNPEYTAVKDEINANAQTQDQIQTSNSNDVDTKNEDNNSEYASKKTKANNVTYAEKQNKNIDIEVEESISSNNNIETIQTNFKGYRTNNIKKPKNKNGILSKRVSDMESKTSIETPETKDLIAQKTIIKDKIEQPITETKMTALVVKQNKYTGEEDTLGKEYTTKVSRPSISPEKSNPRLVNLTTEQEQKVAVVKELPTLKSEELAFVANANTKEAALNLKEDTKQKSNKLKEDKINFSERVEDFKNATMSSLNFKVPTNAGIYLGVNNNFNRGLNDVGGFHIGTNLMMRLKSNLYLIPNLLFTYRVNNAVSVQDYQIANPYQSAPTTFIKDNRTYQSFHTQYDSISTVWNFGKFKTLDLPIMLQYEKGRVGYYGGLNLSYGFKIKNEVLNPTSVAVDRIDTILYNPSTVYSPKNAQSYLYNSNSFNARYGLGYTLGINYYATPNLYIDARLTQSVWTNSKVQSTNNISSYFFTSPTVNLSLGYRFKEKELSRRRK